MDELSYLKAGEITAIFFTSLFFLIVLVTSLLILGYDIHHKRAHKRDQARNIQWSILFLLAAFSAGFFLYFFSPNLWWPFFFFFFFLFFKKKRSSTLFYFLFFSSPNYAHDYVSLLHQRDTYCRDPARSPSPGQYPLLLHLHDAPLPPQHELQPFRTD